MSDSKEIATNSSPISFMDLIAQNVNNPDFDVAKLNALIDANIRVNKIQSEIDFNMAMAALSEEMPRIIKGGSVGYKEDKKNPDSKVIEAFKFARYEDIDEVLRPLLVKYGFSLSYSSEERAANGGGLIFTGTLSHKGGHSRSASIPLALDSSGGKNNIQGMGSTTSYGRRYTMCMLLNVVTVGEDDDGKGLDAFITNEQAVEIDMLITETGAKKITILKLAKANDVREIRVKDFNRVLNSLKALKLDSLGVK